jgi:hypothetical protein
MEIWLDFVGTVLRDIAWPLIVLIITLIFRKNLKQLLGRLKLVKGAGMEVQFSDIMKDIDERIEMVLETEGIPVPILTIAAKTDEIARTSPVNAISYAYGSIEQAMKDKIGQFNPSVNLLQVNKLSWQLYKHKKINRETVEVLNLLRKMRDAVAPAGEAATYQLARDYGIRAEQMVNLINSIPVK